MCLLLLPLSSTCLPLPCYSAGCLDLQPEPLLNGTLLASLQSVYEKLLDHVQKLLEKRTNGSSKPSYTTMPALMATIQVTLATSPLYQQQGCGARRR